MEALDVVVPITSFKEFSYLLEASYFLVDE